MHRTRFRVSTSQWNNSCWFYWALVLIEMRMSPWIWRFSYEKKRLFNKHKASTTAGLLVWGSCLGPPRHLLILHWSLLRWRRRHISPLSALLRCIFIIDVEKRMSFLLPGGYWAVNLQESSFKQTGNGQANQSKASMQNSHSNQV